MSDVRKNWLSRYSANPVCKEYVIRVGEISKLSYGELMTEFKLSIDIVIQMIQLFKTDDSRLHSTFQQINNVIEGFDRISLEHENRIMKYTQRLTYVHEFPSKFNRYFKRSSDRTIAEQEFLPINVHIQHFNIGKLADHMFVSCGAAAAHTKSFRSNGLWQILNVTLHEADVKEDIGKNASCLTYQRHSTAIMALTNLWMEWENVIIGIDQLKKDCITIPDFVCIAKSIIQVILASIRGEKNNEDCNRISQACKMTGDIIKAGQYVLCATDFAGTVKTELQNAYSKCVEFLTKRAMPVIVDDQTQQRLDIIQSNIIVIAVAGIVSAAALAKPEDIGMWSKTGLLMNFESLLSEYGSEIGMMGDYAFGVHFLLENTVFTLTPNVSELQISGNRLEPKILIPCLPEMLVIDDNSERDIAVQFKVVPILFNIGINEKQTIQDTLHKSVNRPSLIDDINKFSLYKLFKWITENLQTGDRNILLNGKFLQLTTAVNARKKKNVEIHKLVSEIIRNLGGARVINCKSGKDRTGMAVTLEQARLLSMYGVPDYSFQKCLDEMRADGVRRANCRKNQNRYLYAFQGIQLQTFPSDYRPPKGSYGHTET